MYKYFIEAISPLLQRLIVIKNFIEKRKNFFIKFKYNIQKNDILPYNMYNIECQV